MLMNYKYVIAGADNDFYDIAFEDVRNKDKNITYLRTAMDFSNPMIRFLRNLHFSGRANMIFNLPGKFIWNRFTFENPYKNTDKICRARSFRIITKEISRMQNSLLFSGFSK